MVFIGTHSFDIDPLSTAERTTKPALKAVDKDKISKPLSNDVIHPSWAAKKQLESGIKQYLGQKTVFDSDSDNS